MESLKIYMDKDIDKSFIMNKKVAVIGYGSQGYGQTLNLRDSGVCVKSALRPDGASAKKAKMEGLDVLSIEEAVQWADVIQILIPDEIQAEVYEKQIKPYLRAGQYLCFSHGFNIHFGKIVAPEGDLEIEKNAICDVESIDANSVVIYGNANGDINAAERVEICSGSCVNSNIRTAKIRIANNVEFNGEVSMIEENPDVDLFQVASSDFKKAMIVHKNPFKI